MAAGSRKTYALDLNDIFAFPDGDNIPSRPPNTEQGESWVMLLDTASAISNAVLILFLCGGNMDFLFCEKIMGFSPSFGLTHATTVDITGKRFKVEINTSNPPLQARSYRVYSECRAKAWNE
jgi:hypothetical protein